jgi:hypothetical protein
MMGLICCAQLETASPALPSVQGHLDDVGIAGLHHVTS